MLPWPDVAITSDVGRAADSDVGREPQFVGTTVCSHWANVVVVSISFHRTEK